jgi:hypothetical protein
MNLSFRRRVRVCSRVKSACQKRPTGVELDLLASRARVKSAEEEEEDLFVFNDTIRFKI